jgi:hypothetical protein
MLFGPECVFLVSSFDYTRVSTILLPFVLHLENFRNYRLINLFRGEKRLLEALAGESHILRV